MKRFCMVIKAEILKQHALSYHSSFALISLLIWPILGFFTVYYTYKPFSLEDATFLGITDGRSLMVFLGTGYMAFTCFLSMVQNAWQLGWTERQSGILEIAYLSPANRLAMVYGKSLGALLQNTWMFVCFCAIIILYAGGLSVGSLLSLPLVFLILILSSTIWGGLMNVIFLFSRDVGILITIFDEPMTLFSGVRVPVASFPLWAKSVGAIFPLTYCLRIIRSVFSRDDDVQIILSLLELFASLGLMVVVTIIAIASAEKMNRKTGQLNLF